jgi:DNA-directed RNA polymerase subunit P
VWVREEPRIRVQGDGRVSDDRLSLGVTYKCVQCGAGITSDQLASMLGIKCPYCGYRVLRKIRPPIVKRVKAE